MKKAIPKSRGGSRPNAGRPATGKDPVRAIRLSDEFLEKVDGWAAQQQDKPGRSEAIRRLVELGLTVGAKQKQTTTATADRAKELASKAINSLTAGAPNSDEKASRKRRLITGPEEFRQVRVDRPKAKGK
jgi:hypothetical protein